MSLHPEKFRVQEVLEDVNSLTSSLASAKNITLLFAEDSDREVEIYADSTRIKQVMINLVNNAIKFTRNEGSVTLRVEAQTARMLFEVRDTGIGIAADQLEYVFDEFRQADESTARSYGGTGLGLAIAREIVLAHHGTITAQSEPGQGSTFTVRLPLASPQPEILPRRRK